MSGLVSAVTTAPAKSTGESGEPSFAGRLENKLGGPNERPQQHAEVGNVVFVEMRQIRVLSKEAHPLGQEEHRSKNRERAAFKGRASKKAASEESATRAAAPGRRSSPALGSSAHRARSSALCSRALVLDDLRALTPRVEYFDHFVSPMSWANWQQRNSGRREPRQAAPVAPRNAMTSNAQVEHDVREEPRQAESRVNTHRDQRQYRHDSA